MPKKQNPAHHEGLATGLLMPFKPAVPALRRSSRARSPNATASIET